MRFIDTANNVATGIITVVKATVVVIMTSLVATVDFLKNLPRNFPTLLRNTWAFLKAGLNLGKTFLLLMYDTAVYLMRHLPEVFRALYDAAAYVLTHIPEVLHFMKDLTVEIVKAIWSFSKFLFKNAFEITKEIIENIPNILAHAVGVMLGIVYAGFIITGKILSALLEIILPKSALESSLSSKQMLEELKNTEHQISFDCELTFTRSFRPLYSSHALRQNEHSVTQMDDMTRLATDTYRISDNRLR